MSKYIFVTGGVVSSLGKGIASASLGAILKSRGLSINLLKLDPYINVDPGTMSPFQHGEVFVTEDGAETDLDLGHYERFVNIKMKKKNNFTTGQIYDSVIKKERKGEYLGRTVQVIPHITDEIKNYITKGSNNSKITIVEIGGTVGDIESLPFLEAVRQMSIDLGKNNYCFIHLTLVPYISTASEIKTKPTQHSVKELREIGIQPDILMCRADRMIPETERHKIALFTNVHESAVISAKDVDCIYKIPFMLHNEGLDRIVLEKLNIKSKKANLSKWKQIVRIIDNAIEEVIIAIVGKYVNLTESYKSLSEAIYHAGIQNKVKIKIRYIDSESIENSKNNLFDNIHAILVPGGFGDRGIEGKIDAIKFAREKDIPFLGICLGMQLAVVEFARNVLKWKNAHSTEFNSKTKFPVVSLITEWVDKEGYMKSRSKSSDMGGTMRLGAQKAFLRQETKVRKIYNLSSIYERHRHRYEINNNFCGKFEDKGLIFSGKSVDFNLCEMLELSSHKWFIGCQFHPEFTSEPLNGHPLFNDFVKNAYKIKKKNELR